MQDINHSVIESGIQTRGQQTVAATWFCVACELRIIFFILLND